MYSLTPLMFALNVVVEISRNKDRYLNASEAYFFSKKKFKSLISNLS